MPRTKTEDDQVVRHHPRAALAYYNRGTTFLDMGRYNLAVRAYSEAIQVHPGNADAYAARAVAFALLGREVEVQHDLECAGELGFIRTHLERAIEEIKEQPRLLRCK
ncbi:MAG: tetratricopeptide repeat protein [Dehalococcoidia bacterium]